MLDLIKQLVTSDLCYDYYVIHIFNNVNSIFYNVFLIFYNTYRYICTDN